MTDPCEDPSGEGFSQGAGGQPNAELHCPPPLPHGSRGCDHRHPARAVLAQTGNLKFSQSIDKKSILFNHCF